MLPIVLTVIGFSLLAAVSYVVIRQTDVDDTFTPCDMYSPDDGVQCDDFIGHNGWCSSGDLQWSGDVWNIGFLDETRASHASLAPTLIQAVTNPQPKAKHRRNWKLWASILFIGFGLGCAATALEEKPATEPVVSEQPRDCGTYNDFRYYSVGCPGHRKHSVYGP